MVGNEVSFVATQQNCAISISIKYLYGRKVKREFRNKFSAKMGKMENDLIKHKETLKWNV